MTRKQDPNDPDSLSLSPGKGGGNAPDFSNVRGQADTVAGARGRPDFSNVRSRIDGVPEGDGRGGAGDQTYTVREGDTLSHIAEHFYGRASRWRAIHDANRDQIENPDLIHPGQVLRIPAIDD